MFSRMLVIRLRRNLSVMRSIIISEHQDRSWILIMIAITEPLEFSRHKNKGFADFQHGPISKAQPDAEVASGCGQELLLVPLQVGVRNAWHKLTDLCEIGCKGRYPAAISFRSSSSLSCR